MLKIAVTGASGRMGRAFMEYLSGREEVRALAVSLPHSRSGRKSIEDELAAQLDNVKLRYGLDVIVDFSSPDETLAAASWAAAQKTAMVIGTTGFTMAQLNRLSDILHDVPVLLSPNMSMMMNLALRMTSNAVTVLPNDSVDVEIIERHHREKRNAPSSTALSLAQIVAEKRGWSLSEALRHEARWGLIGPRPEKEIAISSIRGGSLNSEHTVIFATSGESLEITHRSQTLEPFARGALQAAGWIVKQPPGVYDMLDMLGLSEVLY
ncbi:MAG: 4-hydroxy-tetrahydrodipicolinate reductase [Deltaproteobacteria bacterium]|nr:4-hydroxy-tetrahydrodipicolinate reductase [Deltaproteobacteria bacterium]